jgi:hypothetical protein
VQQVQLYVLLVLPVLMLMLSEVKHVWLVQLVNMLLPVPKYVLIAKLVI